MSSVSELPVSPSRQSVWFSYLPGRAKCPMSLSRVSDSVLDLLQCRGSVRTRALHTRFTHTHTHTHSARLVGHTRTHCASEIKTETELLLTDIYTYTGDCSFTDRFATLMCSHLSHPTPPHHNSDSAYQFRAPLTRGKLIT